MTLRPALLLLACLLLPAAELEVRSVEWGVGGTVRGGGFAPLLLLVGNPGARAVDGIVELVAGDPPAGVAEASVLHLDPGRERWLRFAPWVGRENGEEFALRWRDGGRIAVLPAPTIGQPTAALLVSEADPPRRVQLPRLVAERFPDSPCLLDALGCLVVDQVPAWGPDQAAVLGQWVRLGGTLVLIPGIDGRVPAPAALAPGLDLGACGRGRVLRAAAPREDCGIGVLADAGWSRPTREPDGPQRLDEAGLARSFAAAVTPDLPWGMITVVLIAFTLAIGPLSWWASRRGADWRWINLGLLLAITAASLALWSLGRRGYGEQAVCRSLAIARDAGGGLADVEQHLALFVVGSGERTLAHRSPRNLYACPAEATLVEGAVSAVGGGVFATAIPQFTSRHVAHRAILALPAPAIGQVRWDGRTDQAAVCTITGSGTPTTAMFWDGECLVPMHADGEGWRSDPGSRCKPGEYGLYGIGVGAPQRSLAAIANEQLGMLALRALRGPDGDLPRGAAMLVFLPAPPACAPSGLAERFEGLVLWRLEITPTGKAP